MTRSHLVGLGVPVVDGDLVELEEGHNQRRGVGLRHTLPRTLLTLIHKALDLGVFCHLPRYVSVYNNDM